LGEHIDVQRSKPGWHLVAMGHEQPIRSVLAMSALHPTATKLLRRISDAKGQKRTHALQQISLVVLAQPRRFEVSDRASGILHRPSEGDRISNIRKAEASHRRHATMA
jgi:hypothetical protein